MDFDASLSFLRVEIDRRIQGRFPVPQGFLDTHVKEVSALASILDEELASRLIRHLETIYGTQQGEGHVLKTDFQEWYPGRKGEVDFYYWRRLQKYWLDHSILPVQVVQSVDKVTDEILGYLGDPLEGDSWRRRGLVMGHVQSGKTTNYSALIAKAADAGYRVIVVLAGLTNSLRYQTQVRLDQTFVGKSSLGDNFVSEIYPVSYVLKGLEGEGGEIRHPFCGTTQSADFSVKTAKSVGATEGNFADPILFVTKKNEKVLARLADWLRGLRQDGQLEGPMLLIDDEADNASVNTAKDPGVTTRINARIRELLSCSRRSSYVGYTATPFANIFIDPDTEDSMLKDDLFPEHFIKSLEPPGNYIGAEKLFSDGGELFEACIREIPGDYLDLLPLSHKSGDPVSELPESLEDAVLEFTVFRSIRVLAGESRRHSSMLVNVSRFNAIQRQIHDLIYLLLQDLKAAVDAWASSSSWGSSRLLLRLHEIWEKEYAEHCDFDWDDVRGALRRGLAPVEVRLVNMQGGGLDYTKAPESGMHVIAVGGLALARGLTLEGLAVSYVLRNVGAADTLLQMGRWFGYRPGYERLCRIHATGEMLGDFREVSNAVEELREDLVRMERMGITPNEFGLKVRQSPTGIAITAANKMRAAKPVLMAVDLSTKHLQAFELFNDGSINAEHFAAVTSLVEKLGTGWVEHEVSDDGALVWKGVGVALVQELLREFKLPQLHFALGYEGRSLTSDYIADRASGELALWDIAIPFRRTGEPGIDFPFGRGEGKNIYCRVRHSGVSKSDDPNVVKITAKNVVADAARTDLQYGEREELREQIAKIESEFPDFSPEMQYLMARTRPLLLIHLLDFRLKKSDEKSKKLDFEAGRPVVSISLAFPDTGVAPQPREYAVTKRLAQMMERQRQEAESDEDLDGDE
ncbi:TPA: Z1 domain-containing protein [Pseudomonas aeruginosa]|uniref:Z1 domain-containing protein n=3 Tax=Pseudomonas TaxID=286 RepID=UPI000648F1B8|nr:Z1 domain-containing protein [Pseudomonas aeruginosa]MBG5239289.1 Z1 domain-containing protein [Pseudomonas aeruginosa]MBH9028167.1 Z1 domain-containing protein [Pseudomonas aeruginosa]USI84919.1 Z1 domain-containing protein [Pseudomonas aeruginosa]HBN8392287.1 Z1 domain-containing protein [Pseudomonas aeruginosa]HBO3797195.1 Z1 domain-containing protein [Pseudomonas aeruginosa]